MAVMLFLFFLITLIAVVVLVLLISIIKKKTEYAKKIEIIGYGILTISIIWTGIVNSTNEMSTGSDLLIVDERLRNLWLYEGDKIEYMNSNDLNNLSQDYSALSADISSPVFDDKLIKEQDKTAKKISYVLFLISTLLISVGRLNELFFDSSRKSTSIRKYPKYRRKRNRLK